MEDNDFRELFDGIYMVGGRLATLNLTKGRRVYNEELVERDGKEYRLWNPYRSKLAAAVLKGLKHMVIKKGSSVLYLGAATGTTSSHVSDIVGAEGSVYAVELSERNMREFIKVCEARANMVPILADARDSSAYEQYIEACDVIYQDVSTREQAKVLLENSRFLKKGGTAYFIVKSQSINIKSKPESIYEKELNLLNGKFKVLERFGLEPYDSLHLFAVLEKL
ncbi:MAG: fibrillarin-like rRNA/tRNA 2'-O-methyltransferase [Candidatus Marsarchaeota archaeon]|jgi:fibrillarin-like pre-rRNA processing protein|nr:fibrillarin-like rRNA/tRNA 2'-O-methyltransferase [Candidatus Marsarchaeota archaeon]MCL5418342.1 fibrillarin-like rRNA/tRNA 2'-O-methyltransferase [Candidatus Marsarchaeota archaeon]